MADERMARTRWLSTHVDYRCRHAGACCRAGWPIPLDAGRVDVVRAATRDGRLAVDRPWLLPVAPGEAAGRVAVDGRGHCVFHQHERCVVHGALGHDALPLSCQHFPRVCLVDARGVFVTLSHYCPTAAWMLFDEAPVRIVDGPPALPDGRVPEGLDARGEWPPLLSARVLMDHDSYDAWEAHMVTVLAGPPCAASPEAALARLRTDIDELTRWRPADGPLIDAVRRVATQSASEEDAGGSEDPPVYGDEWAPVVRRFLAAHAFGCWVAYQGRGLTAIVDHLEQVYAVLRREASRVRAARDGTLDREGLHAAIRRTDFLLRHTVDKHPQGKHEGHEGHEEIPS